jgi:hypothetical protein
MEAEIVAPPKHQETEHEGTGGFAIVVPMRCRLLAAAAVLLLPLAARAQFYDLDGAYRCITAAKDACEKSAPAGAAPLAQKPGAVPPSLNDAIERVKHGAATEPDIALIEERAGSEDPHAVEVLAWCKLNGIAMSPDPVAAYLLYGDAARLGVANAKANQRAIFEMRLSSDERQQVLLKENAR